MHYIYREELEILRLGSDSMSLRLRGAFNGGRAYT